MFPTSTLVISKLLGSNLGVPSSNLYPVILSKRFPMRDNGLRALSGYATCPCLPINWMTAFRLPRRPIFTISPTFSGLVGSPTKQWSKISPLSFSHSNTLRVPFIPTPSSSPVIRKLIEPGFFLPSDSSNRRYRSTATTNAPMAPFISTAPRPCKKPFCTTASKGGCCQSLGSPTGTTSVWPA